MKEDCTAAELTDAYLDLFEPDFLVQVASTFPAGVTTPDDHRTTLQDLMSPKGASVGQLVFDVYEHCYHQEFKFVQRDPRGLVIPRALDSDHSLFVAACFGEFPGGGFGYIEDAYRQLGAVDEPVTADNFLSLMLQEAFPLASGAWTIKVSRLKTALVLVDPKSTLDLIDCWNLRSLGLRVIPIPQPWTQQLAPQLRKLVQRDKASWFSGYRTSLFAARSIKPKELDRFAKMINAPKALAMNRRVPTVPSSCGRTGSGLRRTTFFSVRDEIEVSASDDYELHFRALDPVFETRSGGLRHSWATEIDLSAYGADRAAIIPPNIAEPTKLVTRGFWSSGVRLNSSGPVVLSRSRQEPCYWKVPSGIDVVQAWMAGRGLEATPSSAGLLASAAVRSLGQLNRAVIVADARLIKRFETSVKSESGSMTREQLLGCLGKVLKDNARAETRLRRLLDHNVLELGMLLKCETCGRAGWHSLEDLNVALRCPRCLRVFAFARHKPPKDWAYRAIGPFAVRDYAGGSYAVISALRALNVYDPSASTTWCSSVELEDVHGTKLEADFVLFWRRFDWDASLVLGECKTFGHFEASDIDRAKQLRKRFPEAVLAFATFRNTLDESEIAGLKRIAMDCRRKGGGDVLVLTNTELCSPDGMPACWQGFTKPVDVRSIWEQSRKNIGSLCEVTQHIHLGMQFSAGWPGNEMHADVL